MRLNMIVSEVSVSTVVYKSDRNAYAKRRND